MKQVVQNYKTGDLKIEEVTSPCVAKGQVLIKTEASFISAGTERTKIETARMSIVEKAISRLDLVKTVANNIKQEGLLFTIKKASNKLDTPISLGYSCSGTVLEVGDGIFEFAKGQRVACVGEEFAAHSEVNLVPYKFVVSIPDNVNFPDASFVGLGAIALNAVELSQAREGETAAVIGLGLIGQITAQILKAKGCRVVGIEIDEDKLFLAKKHGVDFCANPINDDVEAAVNGATKGAGVDLVIIAAASKNNMPIEMAGKITKNKGRVILVGAMPIIIPRKNYYEKELFFAVARGFGAGLYYQEPQDRWYAYNYRPRSVKQNMNSFLALLSEKKVSVSPLISHRFNLSQAEKAYELIRVGKEKYLGIVFEYSKDPELEKKVTLIKERENRPVHIGFIGAGSFAQGYLLPVLKKRKDVRLIGVATARGISSKSAAEKFGFEYCSTDYKEILNDKNINTVFIVTRHNLHAPIVIEALNKGKNVFVEKPLCLNEKELREIASVYRLRSRGQNPLKLMVGFNRRFSPFIEKTKSFFQNRTGPLMMHYRINAGYLPNNHWAYDLSEGGGRIIGEVCHFVDLLQYLSGTPAIEVFAVSSNRPDEDINKLDNVLISLKFSDGSAGSINYNSIGDSSFPRERVEIFGENSVVVIDNFKKAYFSRTGITKTMRAVSRDMGHNNEVKYYIDSLLSGKSTLIPFDEIERDTLVTFKIIESLKQNRPVVIYIK